MIHLCRFNFFGKEVELSNLVLVQKKLTKELDLSNFLWNRWSLQTFNFCSFYWKEDGHQHDTPMLKSVSSGHLSDSKVLCCIPGFLQSIPMCRLADRSWPPRHRDPISKLMDHIPDILVMHSYTQIPAFRILGMLISSFLKGMISLDQTIIRCMVSLEFVYSNLIGHICGHIQIRAWVLFVSHICLYFDPVFSFSIYLIGLCLPFYHVFSQSISRVKFPVHFYSL